MSLQSQIRHRHYVRVATASNYWVDFSKGKLEKYRRMYGDNFCLVINGPKDRDDAYVLPFHVVQPFFRDDNLDPDSRGWSATIDGSYLIHQGERVEVSHLHNAFSHLVC